MKSRSALSIPLFAFLFLIFDGDTPGKVGSKWYGVTSGGLTGPFSKANEAAAGYYGVKPDAAIQVFGTGGWEDKVGVILHPISQPPAPATETTLSYYVRDGGNDGIFFGAYDTAGDAVLSLPPDEVDSAEVVEIARRGDAVIVVNYWIEHPESDEAGRAYWPGCEFEPES